MKQAATHSGQSGKNDCCHPAGQVPSDRKTIILPLLWFALFTLPVMSFSFWWFLFYGFSPEVFSTQSASGFVYLHFAPFSEPHQSVIFVQGAKVIPGLDGKARSSLLFSAEISSPSGSISPKNLAFPNPYLFKLEKPLNFDPFGHAELSLFAKIWLPPLAKIVLPTCFTYNYSFFV